MKFFSAFLLSLIGSILVTTPCFAKEWKSTIPLKTTRDEVIQLLGNPKIDPTDQKEYFEFPEETVKVR